MQQAHSGEESIPFCTEGGHCAGVTTGSAAGSGDNSLANCNNHAKVAFAVFGSAVSDDHAVGVRQEMKMLLGDVDMLEEIGGPGGNSAEPWVESSTGGGCQSLIRWSILGIKIRILNVEHIHRATGRLERGLAGREFGLENSA